MNEPVIKGCLLPKTPAVFGLLCARKISFSAWAASKSSCARALAVSRIPLDPFQELHSPLLFLSVQELPTCPAHKQPSTAHPLRKREAPITRCHPIFLTSPGFSPNYPSCWALPVLSRSEGTTYFIFFGILRV